jgi:hypothetical protein
MARFRGILLGDLQVQIGRRIVEHEQKGSRKAEYRERVIRDLSFRLTVELGRGFSKSNLEYMRRFYVEYHEAAPQIAQTPSGQSHATVGKIFFKYDPDRD